MMEIGLKLYFKSGWFNNYFTLHIALNFSLFPLNYCSTKKHDLSEENAIKSRAKALVINAQN